MIISTKFTHADLLTAPDDGKRREILDGEIFVTPSPIADHQTIVLNFAFALRSYLLDHPIGKVYIAPLDVIFTEFDVLEPDLLFVLNEHRATVKDWVRGAPDLVVEVLSPTTASRDRGIKLRAYARFGVLEYWIADPEVRAVEVYRLKRKGYELARTLEEGSNLTSTLLPQFTLQISAVFMM